MSMGNNRPSATEPTDAATRYIVAEVMRILMDTPEWRYLQKLVGQQTQEQSDATD